MKCETLSNQVHETFGFGYTAVSLFRTLRPLSSGTLLRLGTLRRLYVRPWGTSRADITSFSGRSVKLRRQVEGQHPHNATAKYHRPPHHRPPIHNHFILSSPSAPFRHCLDTSPSRPSSLCDHDGRSRRDIDKVDKVARWPLRIAGQKTD